MKKFFLKYSPVTKEVSFGLLLFRVLVAIFLMTHGIPKLMNFTGRMDSFRDPIGLGSTLSLTGTVIGEVFAPLFIILGLYTRLATIPMAFTMGVVGFIVHADDPFSGKEKALLFFVCAITLMITGPGKYSLDARRLR